MTKFHSSIKKITILQVCLFLSILFYNVLFDVRSGQAALYPENEPINYSSVFPGPTPPVAPTAPAKPKLNKNQENQTAPKEPAPQKKPIPATKPQPQKPLEKAIEKVPEPAEKQQSSFSSPEKVETDEITGKSTAAEKNNAPSSLGIMGYFVLFLLVGAGGLYAYFHYIPQNKPTKKQKKSLPQPRQSVRPAELEIAAKIKNKSLLEQLIKYDMETYGELRPTLNYDHPFYVEQLIVKYGYGNKEKIHRAIQLYHQRSSQK